MMWALTVWAGPLPIDSDRSILTITEAHRPSVQRPKNIIGANSAVQVGDKRAIPSGVRKSRLTPRRYGLDVCELIPLEPLWERPCQMTGPFNGKPGPSSF